MRFTLAQKNYHEAMRRLIELHYMMESTDEKKWFLNRAILNMIFSILYLTIPRFHPCIYFEEERGFRYGTEGTWIFIDNDLQWYRRLMFRFYEECVKGIIDQAFSITKAIRFVDVLYDEKKIKSGLPKDIIGASDLDDLVFEYFETPKTQILSPKYRLYLDRYHANLNTSPPYYETFYVDFNFDSGLVHTLSDMDMGYLVDHPLEEVTTPRFNEKNKLSAAIRYIFVRYFFLFNSFNRIGICNYDGCKKLIIKKKGDYRKYCHNRVCKQKAFYVGLTDIQEKCMKNQNMWISRQIKEAHKKVNYADKNEELLTDALPQTPHLVTKDICKKCNHQVKGGKCIEMRKRNRKAFGIWAKIDQLREANKLKRKIHKLI